MSYVNVYDMNNPKMPYELKRKALLQSIFTNNLDVAGWIDPFMYQRDLYDVLIEEQYTLVLGGDNAVEHINSMLNNLELIKEDCEDYEEALKAINELVHDYNLYLENFVNMEG